jgi:rhamnosyltransferase
MKKLRSQNYQDFEVIVVDSGSTDGTLGIVKEYGYKFYCIPSEEFHHSRTRNLGAEFSRGDYLVYITQDALPLDNKFLEKLMEWLKDDRVAGVYGRQKAYPCATPMEKFFYSYFYPNERKVITYADLENLTEFYVSHVYVSDVCSAIKKDIWEKINFDKNIIMAEDKKWAIDVLRAGYNLIYEPKATIYHSHNYSITSVFKRRFYDSIAMKQICNSSVAASKGFLYLLNEMKYLMKNHKAWIPYALVYNFARFTGFGLGLNYKRIPSVIEKRMS